MTIEMTRIRAHFTGDSITDAGRSASTDGLGDGYVRDIARRMVEERRDVNVVNSGVAGDRAVDLQRRWDADVLDTEPDVLTVLIGVNDMWRRYDAGDPTTADEFTRTYRDLTTRARRHARYVRLVLMEPFVVPVSVEQEDWLAEDLREKQAVVRTIADEVGATFVPLQSIMLARASESGAALVDDGVHPTTVGHRLIADSWWERTLDIDLR